MLAKYAFDSCQAGASVCSDVFVVLDVAELTAADEVQIAVAVEIEEEGRAGRAHVDDSAEEGRIRGPDRVFRRAAVDVVLQRAGARAEDEIRPAVTVQVDQTGRVPVGGPSQAFEHRRARHPVPGRRAAVVAIVDEPVLVAAGGEVDVVVAVQIHQPGIGVETDVEPELRLGLREHGRGRRAGVRVVLQEAALAQTDQEVEIPIAVQVGQGRHRVRTGHETGEEVRVFDEHRGG